jgi:uncharacterized membrane protein
MTSTIGLSRWLLYGLSLVAVAAGSWLWLSGALTQAQPVAVNAQTGQQPLPTPSARAMTRTQDDGLETATFSLG